MRSASAARSAIIVIAKAVLTALAFAAFAPGSAEASCSQYVQTNSDLPIHQSSLAQLDDAGSSNGATGASIPAAPQRPRPCSGALCSGQPAPPSSPTQIDVPRAGQWAIIATPTQGAVNDPVFSPGDDNDLHPTHRSTSVYHPPRHSSFFYAL
jgi:hypothetical protein